MATNTLRKDKTFIPGVTGQPYRAARPARTSWETRQICAQRPIIDGEAAKPLITVDRDGSIRMTWVGNDANADGSLDTGGGAKTAYYCSQETVQINYPADPGQPFIAAVAPSWDYGLEWSSGARSLQFVTGDAYATFSTHASTIGAICGLSGWEEPQAYNGVSIQHGFYLAKGLAKVMELGIAKTAARAYTGDTVFKVSREDGAVSYWMDDTLVYTSEVASTEPLWLQAVLYAGDDEVFNPTLVQVSEPDLSEVTGQLRLVIPPANMALNRTGGMLRLQVPVPKAKLSYGALAAPSFAILRLVLPPVLPAFYGLVGAVGQLTLAIPPVRAVVADKPVGRLRLKVPVPAWRARSWPHDTLPGGDSLLLLRANSQVHGVSTLPKRNARLRLTGSIAPFAVFTLPASSTRLVVSGALLGLAEVTLPGGAMRAALSGRITALSGVGEVFVLNTTGGDPGGTTQYTGYDFNSYAKLGDQYFGAGPEGLFLLEGDTDAGAPIVASFGFGQLDFGSPQVKVATYCYLGAAAGALALKIDALLAGQPFSYTYPSRQHGGSMREVRFDLGRGLRSSYITPTFYNARGQDFAVDGVQFVINESTRRI